MPLANHPVRRPVLIAPLLLTLAAAGAMVAEEAKPTAPAAPTEQERRLAELAKQLGGEVVGTTNNDRVLADSYYIEAMAKFRQQHVEEAYALVQKAVQAAPDHVGAQNLREKILAVLGRRDSGIRYAQEYFKTMQNAQAEEAAVRLAVDLERGKAKMAAGDFAGANMEFDKVHVGILSFPHQFDWGKTREEVAALVRESEAKYREQEVIKTQQTRTDATTEAVRRQAAVEQALTDKVNVLLAGAQTAYNRDDFRRAEIDAWNAYELDRRREDARDLYLKARRSAHERFDDDYRETREDALSRTHEQIHRDLIPMIDVLVYPEDWDRRTLRKPINIGSQPTDAWLANIQQRLAQTVQIEFDERPFEEVVDYLRKITGANIVVDQKVASGGAIPNLTVKLKDVSFGNALQWIMQQTNLKYALDREAIYISRDAVIGATSTRVYDVSDLLSIPHDMASPLALQSYLPSGSAGAGGAGGAAAPSLFGGGPAPAAGGAAAEDIASIQKFITENTNNKDWDAAKGFGIAAAGPYTLIITHNDTVHAQIAALLAHRRAIGSLMVTTHINLVDVRKNFFEEIGVSFSNNPQGPFLIGSSSDGYTRQSNNAFINGSTNTLLLPENRTTANASQGVGTPAQKGLIIDGSHNPLGFLGIDQIHAIFSAYQDESDLTFSRKTSITSHNGQLAHALFIRQFAYIAGYSVTDGAYDPQIKIINLGERIQVRPIVSHDRKYVTLELEPSSLVLQNLFTVIISSLQRIPVGNNLVVIFAADFPLELPNIEIRALRTTARIPDKGSLILGGYTGSVRQQVQTGVPFLSHIPFLGRLFSRNGIYDENRRLYWLLSVEILDLNERESAQ